MDGGKKEIEARPTLSPSGYLPCGKFLLDRGEERRKERERIPCWAGTRKRRMKKQGEHPIISRS